MLPALLSNFWYIFLVVLFFMGSILVHELGHFWAARLRGMKVLRFSIGFGPKIFSWTGKDGVEYRLSWIPLGGYVALPQLADMGPIEGEQGDGAPLPDAGYLDKMIVSAAGAFMNIVFALLLASIVWLVGIPTSESMTSTRIGVVSPQLELSDGSKVESPASRAGLRSGDLILSIDGVRTSEWLDVMHTLATGSRTSPDGRPRADFVVEREGRTLEVTVHPQLTGAERDRRVGIAPGYEMIVHSVAEGSGAASAGFRAGDRILRAAESPVHHFDAWLRLREAAGAAPLPVRIRRGDTELSLSLPPVAAPREDKDLQFQVGVVVSHPNPFEQILTELRRGYRIIGSLISPTSNIGINKVSGVVGIVISLHEAAAAGIIYLLSLTILINVSLAIFNLLPIPVLDGGHMLFATIGKLRGRPLPASLVMGAQSITMVLLLLFVAYVFVKDIERVARSRAAEAAAAAPAEKPAAGTPAGEPAEASPAAQPAP